MDLLIADIHLCPTRPAITEAFLGFLSEQAGEAETLYILGDLFEYWAGDDDLADPFNQTICSALSALGRRGTRVAVMHGNRDFLLGEAFARASGSTLLADPNQVSLGGVPTLLSHGDALCTDDEAYQTFRQEIRSPDWKTRFLLRPLAERKAMIEALRRQSEVAKQEKSAEIMDANETAVLESMRSAGCQRIIHGHTHRPGAHHFDLEGKPAERWVVPDWRDRAVWLRHDGAKLSFCSAPL